MRITGFDVLSIEIPMRLSIRHALAERRTAQNILVAAHGDEGLSGWGECCPRPYVTGETIRSAREVLARELLPPLVGRTFATWEDVEDVLRALLPDGRPRDRQAAACACELALLDLAGKALGESAGRVLGAVREGALRYGGVIATEDPEAVREQSRFLRDFGVADVKVKVGPSLETNLSILEITRSVLGDGVGLRIDANCAWSAVEAIRQLEAMTPFRLEGVEQPVPARDLEGMKAITTAGLVPVVADESLSTLDDARLLAGERACDVFNVRISKCGGLIPSARIRDLAGAVGLRCQLGAQVGETGILSAAGRHFATRTEGLLWLEGSYGSLLLEQDIAVPDVTVSRGGHAPPLDGPGLGVEPDPERLRAFTTERIEVRA